MPLHDLKVGAADALSVASCFLLLRLPGVDRPAVYQWLVTNVFGSEAMTGRWGLFVLMRVLEWFFIGLFSLLYWLEVPALEKHKVAPLIPWPWNSANGAVRREYRALQLRTLRYIVGMQVAQWVLTLLSPVAEPDPATTSAGALPPWHVTAAQALVMWAFADFGHYWGHRLLHVPSLFRFHKRHHEYKDQTVMATLAVHPVDMLFTEILPALFGPVVLWLLFGVRMHAFTVWIYVIPLSANAFLLHCGYDFVFNPLRMLPLSTGIEERHDLHHRLTDVNFGGAFFVADRFFGTLHEPSPSDWVTPHKAVKSS